MPRPLFSIALPGDRTLSLGARTRVMAILNVTPDSFADAGARLDPGVAIADGERFVAEGADILDIGGESTRPGALAVDADEEWRRIGPVIAGLRARTDACLSVDTYKAEVAERAIDAGADMINDISALRYDPAMARIAARTRVPVVLMHNRGRSADMYREAHYTDVVRAVMDELGERDRAAVEAGIQPDRIILDPGIGFAKRAEHSLEVLAGLGRFQQMHRPLLSGPSRKSFLKVGTGDVPPPEREWGTAAAITASVLFGAHIVRVHDVGAMVQVVRVADAIVQARALQQS